MLVYGLALTLLLTLPYVLGWATQGSDHVFSGFLFGVDDGNSYLGKMRLGAQGEWNFSLFYTAEPHEGAPLLFLPYILPGQISRLFMAETNPALTPLLLGIFHLMRVVFGLLLILVLYRFMAAFVRSVRVRFLALIMATFGGGLGWLLLLVDAVPPEIFIPEGFTLQILLGLPHLALARAALLTGLLLVMDSLHRSNWWPRTLLAGVCFLIVGLAVPFYLVIIYAILGAWGLAIWVRKRAFPLTLLVRSVVAASLTLPLFLYNLIVFSTHPVFAQWSAQNLLPSPPPLHYVLAYLPLGLLAIIGGRWAWARARDDSRYALLIGWPLIVPLLVYLPVNVQRRMAEAVIVPLALLASVGVSLIARRWLACRHNRSQHRAYRQVRLLALAGLLPSSLLLLAISYLAALSSQPPIKYPADEVAALIWLNQNSQPGEVVLSTFETGNRIPAYTHLRVYVGHGPETIHATAKTETAQRFFSDELSPEDRAQLYESMAIHYIFYGATEQQYASSDTPDWAEGLQPIYDADGYVIYGVPPD